MANKFEVKEEVEDESWLLTYADAITLLMAFFVMILNFAEYDMPAFEAASAAIKEELGGQTDVFQPINLLSFKLEDEVAEMDMENAVSVDMDDDGIVLEFASSALYDSGSATVKKSAQPLLEGIASTLAQKSYRGYEIHVEGHTDDIPIATRKFPSNWKLSASRAINVVRFMISKGLEPDRFKATGLADVQPKLPNRDYNGDPLPENQAANRRIVVHLIQ